MEIEQKLTNIIYIGGIKDLVLRTKRKHQKFLSAQNITG